LRLHYFVAFAAIGAYIPFFPTWLGARGIQGLSMSALTALNPILGIVSPVVFGVIADRFGLRGSLLRVAALGALVPLVAMTALGVFDGGPSYGVLFVLVALFAFFRSPLVTVADVTALEEAGSYARTRRFGSLGFTVMAVAVGFLVDVTSPWELPAVITMALAATSLIARRIHERPPGPPVAIGREASRLLRSADFALLLGGVFLWCFAHTSYDLCFSLHLRDLGGSSRDVGVAWAVGVVAEILLMTYAPALFARRATVWLLATGVAATAIRFTLIGSIGALPALLALQPLHGLTFGLTWISGLELVKHRAPEGVLATAQSSFAVAAALGSTCGMLVWGPLYASRGGALVFAVAGGVAALACSAVLALALVRGTGALAGQKTPTDEGIPPAA
jgi:PPP family 3-phenylpropionic acid transporter